MTESIENSADSTAGSEHLFCAYCGTEDKADYGYCDHCGERVAAPDSTRFSTHELGKCQVCSTENQIHARHCMGCGIALEEKPLIHSGQRPMDPSLRDAVFPDPPEATGPPQPGQESSAEPERHRGDRPPPYEGSSRSESRSERLDNWTGNDARDADYRPDADDYDNREYDPLPHQDEDEFNDSGTSEAELPAELNSYNWGAVLLGPIWGVGNRTWIATILFTLWIVPIPPYLGIPLYVGGSIYLGFQANGWAWRSKKWRGIAHFKRTQQNWAFWGFIISPVIVFSILTVPLWSNS